MDRLLLLFCRWSSARCGFPEQGAHLAGTIQKAPGCGEALGAGKPTLQPEPAPSMGWMGGTWAKPAEDQGEKLDILRDIAGFKT